MVDLLLTDEIKALGVSKIEITKDYVCLYNGKSFARSKLYKSSLERTLLELQDKMMFTGHFGDQKAVEKIIILLSDLYVEEQEKNSKEKKEKEKKTESYAQVYKLPGLMAEAILLVDGTPLWLVTEEPGLVTVAEHIDISETEILKPFPRSSYINRPYEFKTLDEIKELIRLSETETLDTIYYRVKGVWKKYIKESDDHLSICSADCIFSYFQDKMGQTHYLFFVGDNDSGKSNNLHIINFLAYRNMLSSDMTAANIYSFLGCEYEGLGTICEDEAEYMDQDRDKMKIYKNGYTAGIRVHRLDLPSTGGRKQDAYNTFCFKAFAAEHRPDSLRAKGFNQRTVELQCTYGIPSYDISEIISPAGDDVDQELLDELNNVRNSLLVYRLVHYYDKIPNIKINLQNREKQLFKPLVRVFQNANIFDTLLKTVGVFVGEKRQAKSHTLTAFLCTLIYDLVARYGGTLESSVIWQGFMDALPGGDKISKFTYKSEEFDERSQKEITEMLKDQFGATSSKHKGGKRRLVFDISKLKQMRDKYNLDVDVRVTSGADGADGADVQLTGTLFGGTDNEKSQDNTTGNTNNFNVTDQKHEENTTDQSNKDPLHSSNAPQAPQAPQNNVDDFSNETCSESELKHETYRMSDGRLGCTKCKAEGDIDQLRSLPCETDLYKDVQPEDGDRP